MTPDIKMVEKMPAPERTAYLKSLTFEELLDLALVWAIRLDELASLNSLSILDGLETRLARDSKSMLLSDELMTKLRTS